MKQLIKIILFTLLSITYASSYAGIVSCEFIAATDESTQQEDGKKKSGAEEDEEEEEPDCD